MTAEYTIALLPNMKKKTLVESILFTDYSSLLLQDYFRALQAGHTVRNCINCKRAFLQTTKAHTIYCDRIYKDTKKTCRQYGPTQFHNEKVENSPIHSLYDKCKRKIDMRQYRLLIKIEQKGEPIQQNIYDDYNATAALIVDYKDRALKGKISIIELEEFYKNI